MKLIGHVACMEKIRNVCNSLFRKPERQGIYRDINGNVSVSLNSICKKWNVNMSRTRTYDWKTILATVCFCAQSNKVNGSMKSERISTNDNIISD
jgi:hypothetical protein